MFPLESKQSWFSGAFASLAFLFFIQQITFLVESIYMLNLLNTKMDARAAGILLLFIPALLFRLKPAKSTYTVIVSIMLICMLLSPLLSTAYRIFSAGIGAGLFLLYFPLRMSDKKASKINWGQSIALATLTSIFFRIAGNTLDVSTTGSTILISWFLVLTAAVLFFIELRQSSTTTESSNSKSDKNRSFISILLNALGIAGCIVFIYFAFSSPGVIVRWTQGNYTITHLLLIIFIVIAVFFNPTSILTSKNTRLMLLIWNGLFLLFFIWNILLHRISFPTLDNIDPVVASGVGSWHSLVSYQMLIFSPVLFMNITWFSRSIWGEKPERLAIPFVLSVLMIILCIFMLIFTNTWGYVGQISRIFRNQFHLPFFVAGLMILLPLLYPRSKTEVMSAEFLRRRYSRALAVLLALLSGGILYYIDKEPVQLYANPSNELTLMTYNIQQGVDLYGNKNFEGQLSKIREINPDILCLQESDAARISGGNSDVVHYFSSQLGYYSYYGPKTVTGTYGTAILSRFPLTNCRTVFTFSSKDEIGTAIADITIAGGNVTIINSHPAGSAKSRQEHIDMVIAHSKNREHVIAMGDYNFRQDSPYYQQATQTLSDAWLSMYPDAIGDIDISKLRKDIADRKRSSGSLLADGKIDMTERIDHIFLSRNFEVKEAHYLPAPESETDHPLHWAVVKIKD